MPLQSWNFRPFGDKKCKNQLWAKKEKRSGRNCFVHINSHKRSRNINCDVESSKCLTLLLPWVQLTRYPAHLCDTHKPNYPWKTVIVSVCLTVWNGCLFSHIFFLSRKKSETTDSLILDPTAFYMLLWKQSQIQDLSISDGLSVNLQ